jgi:hypothetical protein
LGFTLKPASVTSILQGRVTSTALPSIVSLPVTTASRALKSSIRVVSNSIFGYWDTSKKSRFFKWPISLPSSDQRLVASISTLKLPFESPSNRPLHPL